jgi:N-acetyltransferase 10
MVRKKLDERIRTLLQRGVAKHERSLLVLVGDYGKDQVANLHHLLCKTSSGVRARPNVLWCYKKELGFSTHKMKRLKKLKRQRKQGLSANPDDENSGTADNFELFLNGTDIHWCYYKDTHRVLGTTNGMLVLQDFEALTPNLLARTVETVEGGGLVVLLLHSVTSLKQLYTMTMDVHARYRTESGGAVTEPRFNERFLLSLTQCTSCLVCDDELNILPHAGSKKTLQSLSHADTRLLSYHNESNNSDGGDNEAKTKEAKELASLKESLMDTPHVGSLIELAKTLDQARAILVFLECLSDKTSAGSGKGMGNTGGGKKTIAMTAARGRGKSAAMGLCLAGAISFGYSALNVTAPSEENVVAVFDFVVRGLKALQYQEHLDYSISYNTNKAGREGTKCIVAIDVHRDHKQSIRYAPPTAVDQFAAAEIVAIDEAAAIPLPTVKALMMGGHNGGHSNRLTFMSSTVNGYEGTGRALSLKLIKELRDNHQQGVVGAASNAASSIKGTKGGKVNKVSES